MKASLVDIIAVIGVIGCCIYTIGSGLIWIYNHFAYIP